MANTEAMSDAENDADVMAFLQSAMDQLADGARERFQKSGRGLWVAQIGRDLDPIPYGWVTSASRADTVRHSPKSDEAIGMSLELSTPVADYDPRREFVLLAVHPDGTSSWQTVGRTPIGWG